MVRILISGRLPAVHSTDQSGSAAASATETAGESRYGPAQMIMVELQGSIEAHGLVDQEGQLSIAGVHVGELVIDKDTALLYIGNHILDGQKVALPKSLVILEKTASIDLCPPSDVSADMDTNTEDESSSADQPSQQTHLVKRDPISSKADSYYNAVYLITHKYVFKTRPQHLVTAHNKDFAGLTPYTASSNHR
ncbi:hypothetical protein BSLG_007969 [Batrachochytrium salamandrivorans]|nr:hypothetical protein BASA83_001199 [Batrachochytrium salamandrivorans]KAJ1334814.1 hypothetical protein BSLG_007969 [Batrachochytrium salamandrivorans]